MYIPIYITKYILYWIHSIMYMVYNITYFMLDDVTCIIVMYYVIHYI